MRSAIMVPITRMVTGARTVMMTGESATRSENIRNSLIKWLLSRGSSPQLETILSNQLDKSRKKMQ